jgi:hypothetical protein
MEWYGEDHQSTAAIQLELAETFVAAKKPLEALKSLDSANIYMSKQLIENHELLYVMMSLRGMVKDQMGDRAGAERLLQQAYVGLRDRFDDSHHLTRQAFRRLQDHRNGT